MPLNDGVGEIFMEAEAHAASNSLERFHVEDAGIFVPDTNAVRDELRVVLLVESPHTLEVCHGYPLAGARATSAGRHVRDKLMEFGQGLQLPEQPIGRLVHQGFDAVQGLGIMNVSQLPFQSDAYDCAPWEDGDCRDCPGWNNYIGHMEYIKDKPKPNTRRDPIRQELDDAIAEDLRGRLENLRDGPDVLLVRCGDVARSFCRKATNGEPAIVMPNTCNLPHPTRRPGRVEREGRILRQWERGWQTLTPQEEQCLRDIVDLVGP